MKTAKNWMLLSLMAVMAAAPGFAANAATTSTGGATACAATACTQGSGASGATARGDSTQGSASADPVSVGVGKNGVSVKVNGGLTFGKSILGKVLGGN